MRDSVATLLAQHADPSVADIAALRKDYPPHAVHAALTIGRLQPKAAGPDGKFPHLAYAWATPEALEQASGAAVACHKAQRFAALKPAAIVDFCAGIGGDTLALADIAPTTAIDLSPIRTACLRYNLESAPPRHPVEVITGDIITLLAQSSVPSPSSSLFHLDPARRSAGKRSPRYADLIPGPPIINDIIARFPGGALKLSPAVDFASLPPGHLELISHNRSVVQAVLWLGALADTFPPNTRTATILSNNNSPFTFTAPPQAQGLQSLGLRPPHYLYESDGALTRAALAHPLATSLALTPLTPDAGYLLSDHLLRHPALILFQILDSIIPYSEKRALAALKRLAPAHPPGAIEVKTRGRLAQVDTDRLQKIFTVAAPVQLTILIFSQGRAPAALIATRIEKGSNIVS